MDQTPRFVARWLLPRAPKVLFAGWWEKIKNKTHTNKVEGGESGSHPSSTFVPPPR